MTLPWATSQKTSLQLDLDRTIFSMLYPAFHTMEWLKCYPVETVYCLLICQLDLERYYQQYRHYSLSR